MILNSDVASERSRTTVGLEFAGLCRNGITFFVIGDLLSVEHDDCPGSVQSDFEFVRFPPGFRCECARALVRDTKGSARIRVTALRPDRPARRREGASDLQ